MLDFKNGAVFKLKQNDEYKSQVAALLIDGEKVIGSYKGVRDGVVFTDQRIIAVNVQGIMGRKRDYSSLPYSKITAFSVETAGTFDLDSELELWFSGLGRVRFEFTGSTKIVEIGRLISELALR